ncbi:redoxin domain-containing protein [Sulfitobacter sp. S190]|uniref:redoxin domain-containing protein n=1 Tax=Sulfitobacter sp. S190 TaxID=2867022 RepID=UPI0021A7300D|nr:redoxin domain-containing protein [Sulfitobacter sp. S190]UWR23614.1 redoxin domain-containing protein [Sulfitobacter sp. S190]
MATLTAGSPFPKIDTPLLGGGTLTLGAPRGDNDWQMVVVYRGLHCPLCKKYIGALNGMVADFNDLGVDVVAVSGDPEQKAQAFADEVGVDAVPVGYDLSIAQMDALGLYVSDPRSPQETDQPFAEPGLFVINADGNIQIVDVSNAPFARPDLETIRNGIKFIRNNDYPVRGTHKAA